jgi:hypothetical protein
VMTPVSIFVAVTVTAGSKAPVTSVTVPLTLALTDWADVLGHRKSAAIAADASNLRTIVHLLWQDASFPAKSAHKQERIVNPDWKAAFTVTVTASPFLS